MTEKSTYDELLQKIANLNESLEVYRHLFDTAMVGIYRTRLDDGKFLAANPSLARMMGYESVDALLREYVTSTHYADPERRRELLRRLQAEGKVDNYEVEMRRTDGSTIHIALSSTAFPEKGYSEGVIVDISPRKRYERELKDSQARLQALSDASFDAVFLSKNGICIDQNATAERMFGYSRQEAIGRPGTEWVAPGDRRRVEENLRRGNVGPYEATARRKDGSTFPCEIQARTIDYRGNAVRFTSLRDITERKQAESALKQSEQRFRTLVETSPLGVAIISKNGHFQYVNPPFTEMFGYTIADIPNGKVWFRKAFPDPIERRRAFQAWVDDRRRTGPGRPRPRTFIVTCRDGSRKDIHFVPVGMENHDQFVIFEDVSERLRMEQQLHQAQKFEAIGTLAGGIAHDFNNLLMGIQGRASLMSVEPGLRGSQKEHIDAIEGYVRSAANLTRQLLGFARGGKYEVRVVDLDDLVRTCADLFGRTRKQIRIHTRSSPRPVAVEADKGQIEQVLLNIFVNAWQAMPEGGDLYLESEPVELPEAFCLPHQAVPGPYVKVSIRDTGIGMDRATRGRIFDPFFTTKEKGRGTGLGLASAYGIIHNHGGIITVDSAPGHGTTFHLYLPRSERSLPTDVAARPGLVGGSETVLLVDDEEMVLDVGRALLEELGYEVRVADGYDSAVAAVSRAQSDVDLVILDLVMPGKDGGQTFDRIRQIAPAVPVILASGYAVNGQPAEILRRGCEGFIQKPFDIATLSRKIRGVLDGRRPQPPPDTRDPV